MTDSIYFKSGYSDVNGLKMYYEIHGAGGMPLVLIHGGGSTIQTSFARIIPQLAKHRQIIGIELQAHGHTNDRDANLSFVQDADDVAKLLENIEITKADFLGFSNGGQTAIEIALRHSNLANKIIICSAFYKRSAAAEQFWEGMKNAQFSDMPQAYKDAYLKINNDKAALMNMFNRDVQRMQTFADWSDEQMKLIKTPVLIFNGTEDVGSIEHAVEMYRILPNAKLAILPGAHGEYLGEMATAKKGSKIPELVVTMIEEFLDEQA